MRVKINGYNIDQYCGGLVSSQIYSSLISPRDGAAKVRTRVLHLEGEVKGANQAAVDTQIAALEAAVNSLGQPGGGDVGLTLNDGSSPSEHWLDNSASEGGIRCVNFQWAPCIGNEYVVRRKFMLVCEADFKVSGVPNLLNVEESIRLVGTGDEIFVYQPVLNGPWRKVVTNSQSTRMVVQTGTKTGYEYVEPANSPLFPDEHKERRNIDQNYGTWVNGKKRNFVRTWAYYYESNNVFGIPS